MEAAPTILAAGPTFSVVGALLLAVAGPQIVPFLVTSGLIAGALLTGMN